MGKQIVMMRSTILVAALLVAVAATVPTEQDALLSESITGNFACKVDSVEVNLDVAGSQDKGTITTDDLKTALARTATLEWAHVNQFFFSSTDGRDDEKSLYTGGGDMGEFIQSLISYTKVTGATLVQADVSDLFSRYLKVMSTDAFEFIGDPFLKWMMLSADELDFPREYISYAIIAFHEALWAVTPDSSKLCYREVKGKADPKAIIHIKTPGYCVDQGLAPLISSQMCTGQVMLDHQDAVKLFRRELVQLIAKAGDNPQQILSNFNTIVAEYQDKFYEQFAGVPHFTVNFAHSATLEE